MKIFVMIGVLILFIVGCGKDIEVAKSDEAVLYSRLNNIDINSVKLKSNLLYFSDTKDIRFYADNSIHSHSSAEWVDVKVKDKKGNIHIYSVMKSPLYRSGYEVTDISYDKMANFCYDNFKASILSIYVLEEARKNRLIYPALKYEVLTPIDKDDDDIFVRSGDKLVINDTDIVKFNWLNEKYYSVPFTFRSKYATFRCMKEK